jgi:hypothetical protein
MRISHFLFAAGVSLAMALTFSCSTEDLKDFLEGGSSSSGVNNSSSSGVNNSSSSEGNSSSSGYILGSCIGADHGYQVCVEYLRNYSGGATAARQECARGDGTWSANSACPAGHYDKEEYLEEGGIIYRYDILVEIDDEECAAIAQELAACYAACYIAGADALEAGFNFDISECIATDCNNEYYSEHCAR